MSRRLRIRATAGVLIGSSLLLAACADPGSDDFDDDPQAGITTVSFRLWDEAAAAAYQESFDAFTVTHRDIHIEVEVVAQESYWSRLEKDIEDGTAPDIFWTNTANFGRYADAGQLVNVTEALGEDHDTWQPALVDLYTRGDQLWGVPQLWDSIALYYNADLVAEVGVDPTELTWLPEPEPAEPAPTDGPSTAPGEATDAATGSASGTPATNGPAQRPATVASRVLTWARSTAGTAAADTDEAGGETTGTESAAAEPAEPLPTPEPTGPQDTLLPAALALTVDADGRTADDEDFDPARIVQYGFNAQPDPHSLLLPFFAQAGAEFQSGDQLAFASPEGATAIEYLVDLVNVHHVAPPAELTATDRHATLELFLEGRLALYQAGTDDLRRIADTADFDWGIAPAVAGPQGPVSLVHGVVAAADAHGDNLSAVTEVLDWVGSTDGQLALASQGIALPGVVAAGPAFLDYWQRAGVDVSAFLDAADGELAAPPTGPRVQAGLEAMMPILTDAFRGELPASEAVADAQTAGNAALAPR